MAFERVDPARLFHPEKKENVVIGRLYLHRGGLPLFNEANGMDTRESALNYGAHSFEKHFPAVSPNQTYFIGIVWGDVEKNAKMLDLFGFSLPEKTWPGNPEVSAWTIRNEVLVRENPIACGEGIVALANEELYRLSCPSLAKYLESSPIQTPNSLLGIRVL